MINSCLPFQIGIIGDSHLVRMVEFIDGDFNLYGKGGEKALNWQLYTNALVENDFIIVFLGGNDITGRLRENAPSSLKGLCQNMKQMDNFCKEKGSVLISCDIIPRMANPVGTDHANHRLVKRFKKRHIEFDGFTFKMADDGVHLLPDNYKELWTVFRQKIVKKCLSLFGDI